jgi:hypothetical protein
MPGPNEYDHDSKESDMHVLEVRNDELMDSITRQAAAVSTVNYLAFGLPVLIAGVATSHFGLHDTALVYSVGIALLAAAAAGGVLFESRARAPQAAAPPPELPPGPCTVPPYTQAAHQETQAATRQNLP